MLGNVTSDRDFSGPLTSLLEALPSNVYTPATWGTTPAQKAEGLAVPSQVNYVGLAENLYGLGYQLDGSAMVIARYLRNAYLWERVRVQGGAYGGMCWFDSRSGVFSFVSYRDPNVSKTLKIYRAAGEYLQNLELNNDELTKSIVGAIGDLDQYQLPDAKGFTSLTRRLTGDTDEFRQRLREEILGTTREDFQKFGKALGEFNEAPATIVLGSADALKKAGGLEIVKVL